MAPNTGGREMTIRSTVSSYPQQYYNYLEYYLKNFLKTTFIIKRRKRKTFRIFSLLIEKFNAKGIFEMKYLTKNYYITSKDA